MAQQQQIFERQTKIAELVRTAGFISVDSLAQHFGVTPQTIRRDVNQLCDEGMLRRIHGGVAPPADRPNIDYRKRKLINLKAKEEIAATVAERIPDHASLAISIGTTPELCAKALRGHSHLRIFTYNFNAAFVRSENATSERTVPAGRLRTQDKDLLGSSAVDLFKAYKVDVGVFGVGGVDSDGTLLDFYEGEVGARQAILANCRRAYLVLDQSKFGRTAHVRGGHITEVDAVFCDAPPPESIRHILEDAGVELVICDNGGKKKRPALG